MFTKPIALPSWVVKDCFHVPARAHESAGIEQAAAGAECRAGGGREQRTPGVVPATEPSWESKGRMHRIIGGRWPVGALGAVGDQWGLRWPGKRAWRR